MSNQIVTGFENDKYVFYDRIEYNSALGLISGGVITQLNSTQYRIDSGVGQLKDGSFVKWDTTTITSPLIGQEASICVDNEGFHEIVIDHSTRINKIRLGLIGIVEGISILGIASEPYVATDRQATLVDFLSTFMPINIDGNLYGPNNSNLFIDKTEGNIFNIGRNFHIDSTNPDRIHIPASTQTSLLYNFRPLNIIPSDEVIPGSWDNNGVLTAVPLGQWTIQRIYLFPSPEQSDTGIAFGQQTFNSSDNAISNINSRMYEEVQIFDAAILLDFLIVRGGATDLSNLGDAVFF